MREINKEDQSPEIVSIGRELERVRCSFHTLLDSATKEDLNRRSDGTRWTNQQLLFHMMFGYMVVRSLLVLVKCFGRLPPSFSRVFAAALNASTGPFNLVNYLGSCVGALVYRGQRMEDKFDAVIASLRRHVDREQDSAMKRSMAFPVRWDPFFKPFMTLADAYHYPTQHFEFHRRQLTLRSEQASGLEATDQSTSCLH